MSVCKTQTSIEKMDRFALLTILCVTFLVSVSMGSRLPREDESEFPEELILPKNLNLTELTQILQTDHPHMHLDVKGIVELYEYGIEIHTAETSDNYLLELHRITGNKINKNPAGKPPILLMHGLMSSSMDWVIAGPGKGFGFILADAGYDVWLGNVRGSKYSRKHKRLTTDEPTYWGFDWHEIGTRDLPTMIDHILKVTGRKKLFYAGHSQGSTTFYVMATELPEYNNKINAMFSLAPVAYCSRMFSPIFQALARLINPLNLLTKLIGMYEFKPTDEFFKKFTSQICQENSPLQPLCMNALFMIGGFNWDQMDTALLPAILAHIPAGAGVNQFVHYAQIIKSGHFRQFDLGLLGNLVKYHKLKPPAYNLKKVKAPVSLHYSANDWLSDVADVQKLYSHLPNPIGKFRVPHDKFNHLDFLWAKDVKQLLYDKIISIMRRYNKD